MLYGIARKADETGAISPWRTISLFLGGLTLVGSAFCYFILGSPQEVKWLTEEEKKIA